MAKERQYSLIGPLLFTSDGENGGLITLESTRGLKVNNKVVVSANGLPTIAGDLKILEVIDKHVLRVGFGGNKPIVNLAPYTVSGGASITRPAQDRAKVPEDDQNRATYEQEPTLARRAILVDEWGDPYNEVNKIHVDVDQVDNESLAQINISNLIVSNDNFYPILISASAKKFIIKARDVTSLLLKATHASSDFMTIRAGTSYSEFVTLKENMTLYVQSTRNNQVVELITWN